MRNFLFAGSFLFLAISLHAEIKFKNNTDVEAIFDVRAQISDSIVVKGNSTENYVPQEIKLVAAVKPISQRSSIICQGELKSTDNKTVVLSLDAGELSYKCHIE